MASGIGRYLSMDPVVVRIGFVLLTLAGGLGLPLYALVWATVPAEGSNDSVAETLLRRIAVAPPWVRIALGAVGLIMLLSALAEGSGIVSGLILIVIGVLLFRRGGADVPPTPPPASGSGATAASYWPGTAPASSGSRPPTPDTQGWAPPAEPPRPRRPPSVLGRLALTAILLVLGFVAALQLLGVVRVTAEQYVALILLITGAALVVGARWGRARWLIALGIALLPLLAAANLLGVAASGSVGQRIERPRALSAVAEEYRLLAGSTRLDLSGVDFAQEPTGVAASVGFGELIVVVPPEARVEVDAEIRVGTLDLFGEDVAGEDLRRVVVQEGEEGGGRLELDIDAGVGVVSVRRATGRSVS